MDTHPQQSYEQSKQYMGVKIEWGDKWQVLNDRVNQLIDTDESSMSPSIQLEAAATVASVAARLARQGAVLLQTNKHSKRQATEKTESVAHSHSRHTRQKYVWTAGPLCSHGCNL